MPFSIHYFIILLLLLFVMEKNIIYTNKYGERVTSVYAETYNDDRHCPFTHIASKEELDRKCLNAKKDQSQEEWVSPSDLLIGILELKPPFTSKITRGKTHEGILAIGGSVLEKERATFLKSLTGLIHDNDSSWNYILNHEKDSVDKKVKDIYTKIFDKKSKIMSQEIEKFYEKSLQELEDHMRTEIQKVLASAHASIISDLNKEIKEKLAKERKIVEETLKNRYLSEVKKMKTYYKLLINNELDRNNQLINQSLNQRNEALKAFYKQFEAENLTSTMYIMCTERKKCRIRQFILDSYQTTDLTDKLQKIKDRQNLIDNMKQKQTHISEINKEWEDKIKKILQLFLKFISFSLKLLPEQTTFLLDLEKMVVLQLNEIHKVPNQLSSILVDENKLNNIFKFEMPQEIETLCKEDAFVIEGDLSDPIPPKYGSRETLPSDVDLPFVRVQRQFMYAKCHHYEEIKEMLSAPLCSKYCTCALDSSICEESLLGINKKSTEFVSKFPTKTEHPIKKHRSTLDIKESVPESIIEPLLIDDIHRLRECPDRHCYDWGKRQTFPNLNFYLDFTEDNFERVKTILGELPKLKSAPELISAKDIAHRELPFSETHEPYHNAETQYSSQEDLSIPDVTCSCAANNFDTNKSSELYDTKKESLSEMLQKHKTSLRRMMQQNTNLLKMFTDECFDFIM